MLLSTRTTHDPLDPHEIASREANALLESIGASPPAGGSRRALRRRPRANCCRLVPVYAAAVIDRPKEVATREARPHGRLYWLPMAFLMLSMMLSSSSSLWHLPWPIVSLL